MKTVLILGHSLVKEDIITQFQRLGYGILDNPAQPAEEIALSLNEIEVIVIMSPSDGIEPLEADNQAFDLLQKLKKEDGKIRTVHLLLNSYESIWALRKNDLSKDLTKYFDIYPICLEDEWARKVVSEIALPEKPIDIRSDIRQHLVILGMNERSQLLAINAALIFHYPNYTRNHKLRSRITIIDEDIQHHLPRMLHLYESLFQHSYYRVVDTLEKNRVLYTHKPENLSGQEDYVDVEWEFVSGNCYDEMVQSKLKFWASSHLTQHLSVVISTDSDEQNLSIALHLPERLYASRTQIYVRQRQENLLKSLQLSSKYSSLHFYGMENKGYDVTLPLVRMGKIVNDVYDQCYQDNFGPNVKREQLYNAIAFNPQEQEEKWKKVKPVKRYSNIFNAMTVPVKLHSVGIKQEEWSQCYDLPESEIQILAEVEHNRWCVEELILGFRPCSQAEQDEIDWDITLKDIYKKKGIHYDLRAFRELRKDITGRNANVYDIVIVRSLPLIAAEYQKEGGNN